MASAKQFEDLMCWKDARILAKELFLLKGPIRNDWDTRSQLRRAGVSVMNNIAEGFSRFSDKDFSRFLKIAYSSANEVKSMFYLMEDIGYFDHQELKPLYEQVEKTKSRILRLIQYLDK